MDPGEHLRCNENGLQLPEKHLEKKKTRYFEHSKALKRQIKAIKVE